jgi:Ca2+-binding EF-hand superfamily protein
MSKGKNTAVPASSGKNTFDPKSYAKGHITEDDVIAAKASFDLFDSDQGGSIDIKGTHLKNTELKAAMTSLGFF